MESSEDLPNADTPPEPPTSAGASSSGSVGNVGTLPSQLGTRRFVYAAYLAGACIIAFLFSKAVDGIWIWLATKKPALGEPRDEVVFPIAGVLGIAVAIYMWRRTRTRQLAEEVASELEQVTWPGREEVINSTIVVIVATLLATVFFFVMDRFWGYLTNLVYGA